MDRYHHDLPFTSRRSSNELGVASVGRHHLESEAAKHAKHLLRREPSQARHQPAIGGAS